ncbi:MAG: DHH family phosphoesterase [Lachnospiraceae bacterium]|nr:DHH family phosphoesterase [Candidatus Equihabitans merdae]
MNNVSASGHLKKYFLIPGILGIFWAVLVVMLFTLNQNAGILALLFLIVYGIIITAAWFFMKNRLFKDLIGFAEDYSHFQRGVIEDFVLPYGLLDTSGKFLWANKPLKDLLGKEYRFNRPISAILPGISPDKLPSERERTECKASFADKDFRAVFQLVHMEEFLNDQSVVNTTDMDSDPHLIAMYLSDETDINQLLREREDNRQVCGLLNLDNYDEAMEGVEEVRQSLLLALVDRKIQKHFTEAGGVVRKLDHDRFFFVMRKGAFERMKAERFPILNDVKTTNVSRANPMTVSIGIGLGGKNYAEDAESARVAMELALGRGGDQAVVKDGDSTTYYGGKTASVEKGTRVRARIKAQALREIMSSRELILVMAHKRMDIDALGAAMGICRTAMSIDKEVHVVINEPSAFIRSILDDLRKTGDYPENLFVEPRVAAEMADADAAVVLVDTSLPSQAESEQILKKAGAVVVIDHHRQSKDSVKNAVLEYVEPSASSACEMVSEILQYFGEKVRPSALEADIMYGGIVIDTNNFRSRSGVRTFEAAAYLRRNGADIVRVRKRLRDTMSLYKTRAAIISEAELFEGAFAIAVCPPQMGEVSTIVGAQAANELLNVEGVKASFVLTDCKDYINISARAIDEINVQLIMERLGGGGHMDIAATQLRDVTMDEAKELLKETIITMQKEGDIS